MRLRQNDVALSLPLMVIGNRGREIGDFPNRAVAEGVSDGWWGWELASLPATAHISSPPIESHACRSPCPFRQHGLPRVRRAPHRRQDAGPWLRHLAGKISTTRILRQKACCTIQSAQVTKGHKSPGRDFQAVEVILSLSDEAYAAWAP